MDKGVNENDPCEFTKIIKYGQKVFVSMDING